jgi:peptidoglycan/xylan/chitin deacetylase (PgdA/CDA1 family)
MYHRVAAPDRDPYGLAVHPDRFAQHMEQLLAMRNTMPLQDLVDRPASGQVAVTFDDGYQDNATVAAPMMAEAGIPATWFITAGRLGERRFWWDRLADGLLGPHLRLDAVDLSVAGRDVWLDLRTSSARTTALRFLHRRLRPLPPEVLEAAVDEVTERLGMPDRTGEGLTMTVEQLRGLAALPLQEVGAHTRSHLQLRGQREDLQREEIFGSVADLTGVLDQPVRTFAYPFGSESTVGALAPRLAAEAGCTLACSTAPGPVRPRGNRYLLPRLNVEDWDGREFRARLDAALADR